MLLLTPITRAIRERNASRPARRKYRDAHAHDYLVLLNEGLADVRPFNSFIEARCYAEDQASIFAGTITIRDTVRKVDTQIQ